MTRVGEGCRRVLRGSVLASQSVERLAGTDAVDSDTFRGELNGHGAGEGDDCAFCGAVVEHLGRAFESGDRGSVDDGSTALHVWYRGPTYTIRPRVKGSIRKRPTW